MVKGFVEGVYLSNFDTSVLLWFVHARHEKTKNKKIPLIFMALILLCSSLVKRLPDPIPVKGG